MSDYLDRDALLSLGIDAADADQLLRRSQWTGHDRRPVIPADRLDAMLAELGAGDDLPDHAGGDV